MLDGMKSIPCCRAKRFWVIWSRLEIAVGFNVVFAFVDKVLIQ